jgi:hypothetical protein
MHTIRHDSFGAAKPSTVAHLVTRAGGSMPDGRRMIARSPGQRLQLELSAGPAGIDWRVLHGEAAVLERSALRLPLPGGRVLGNRVRVIGGSRSLREVPFASRGEFPRCAEQIRLDLEDTTTGLHFAVVGCAYDEGVAVRYVLGRQASPYGRLRLAGEHTSFRFPSGTRLVHGRDSRPLEPITDRVVTVRLPCGALVALCESDRLDDYPHLTLRSATNSRDSLTTHLNREFAVPLPFATPWRVLLLGERPRELIENAALLRALATPGQPGEPRSMGLVAAASH